jgi:hypothetical protein
MFISSTYADDWRRTTLRSFRLHGHGYRLSGEGRQRLLVMIEQARGAA